MITAALVLVIAAAVTLIWGFLTEGLVMVFVSMGLTVGALALLGLAVWRSNQGDGAVKSGDDVDPDRDDYVPPEDREPTDPRASDAPTSRVEVDEGQAGGAPSADADADEGGATAAEAADAGGEPAEQEPHGDEAADGTPTGTGTAGAAAGTTADARSEPVEGKPDGARDRPGSEVGAAGDAPAVDESTGGPEADHTQRIEAEEPAETGAAPDGATADAADERAASASDPSTDGVPDERAGEQPQAREIMARRAKER